MFPTSTNNPIAGSSTRHDMNVVGVNHLSSTYLFIFLGFVSLVILLVIFFKPNCKQQRIKKIRQSFKEYEERIKNEYPNYIKLEYIPQNPIDSIYYVASLRYKVFLPPGEETSSICIFKFIMDGDQKGLKEFLGKLQPTKKKEVVNSTLPKENIFFTESIINNRDYKDTPLHFACYYNHPEMVKLFLDNDADVYATSSGGQTPLYTLCFNHRIIDDKKENENKINIAKQLIGSMNKPDQNQKIIQPIFKKLIQPQSVIRSIEEIVILLIPFFSDEQKKQLFNKACSDEYLPKIVDAILEQNKQNEILTASDLTNCLKKVKRSFYPGSKPKQEMKIKLIEEGAIDGDYDK
jgi:hypothetical protein